MGTIKHGTIKMPDSQNRQACYNFHNREKLFPFSYISKNVQVKNTPSQPILVNMTQDKTFETEADKQ